MEGEVAGCRVQLQLDTRSAPWHEELPGTLFLQGGATTRTFSLYVGIDEYPDQVARGQELLPDRSWDRIEVKPHEQVRVCFALRMPGSVPFGRRRFSAKARSSWRHSTALTAEIHVAPPVPFQRMATLLEEVIRVPARSWSTLELGDGVVAQFTPEREDPRPFDDLRLELFRNNGMIYGTLSVDPLDRTFADRLRSAAGADRVTVPFRFPEHDLSGVRGHYEQHLRPILDSLRELPIPAVQPKPARSELPLPADSGATADLGP